jgi:hypothetical protein
MPAIDIKAVILASLAVFGVDIISSMILFDAFDGPTLNAQMTDEQIARLLQPLYQDVRYLTIGLILGTLSTVLGGYLSARLAKSVPYYNALAFGAVSLLVGSFTSAEVPLWARIVGLGLTLPAALLGGYLAKLRTPAS